MNHQTIQALDTLAVSASSHLTSSGSTMLFLSNSERRVWLGQVLERLRGLCSEQDVQSELGRS